MTEKGDFQAYCRLGLGLGAGTQMNIIELSLFEGTLLWFFPFFEFAQRLSRANDT